MLWTPPTLDAKEVPYDWVPYEDLFEKMKMHYYKFYYYFLLFNIYFN